MKITRRKFFSSLITIVSVPFLYALNSEVERKIEIDKRKEKIYLPADLGNGIFFFNSVIIIKEGEKISVYSSKCSHLGCKINKVENGKIVCPCHGSVYGLNGEVVKGPAVKPLKKLSINKEIESGRLFVYEQPF
ncbi:ubiquinol-cytochrome c reductase iron-sulfur subunit [Melioribacteraceae bacterium 4301-Me]|uniref:QcrA and Rieske domain-containing protein n=1 Tax=Pyranulibacter aquaticus TaxID=3163344 RepID=UPI00359530F8